MAGSGVTPASLRAGILSVLLSRVPTLATFSDDMLQDGINEAERLTERELGTRFDVTEFRTWKDAAEPTDAQGVEFEAPYDWPGRIPGDGFPRLRPMVRPIVSVLGLKLSLPGAIISTFEIPLPWLRVDRGRNEILVAPSGGSAVFALAYGQGMMSWRLPQTAGLNYTAGLGDAGLAKWPTIRHMVERQAVLHVLPAMSLWLNPTVLTSVSADGLSQSRGSGYIFKDIQEVLQKEVETIRNSILSQWDGPLVMVL